MTTEIERKFLVANDGWRLAIIDSQELCDGLLARFGEGKVRVRVAANVAWITVKGARSGIGRAEFEYEIPREQGEEMLRTLCTGPLVEKTRYFVADGPLVWTVDVHKGALEGVVLAEIELQHEAQPVPLPAWIGSEVTGDPRFRKRALLDLGEGAQQMVREFVASRR